MSSTDEAPSELADQPARKKLRVEDNEAGEAQNATGVEGSVLSSALEAPPTTLFVTGLPVHAEPSDNFGEVASALTALASQYGEIANVDVLRQPRLLGKAFIQFKSQADIERLFSACTVDTADDGAVRRKMALLGTEITIEVKKAAKTARRTDMSSLPRELPTLFVQCESIKSERQLCDYLRHTCRVRRPLPCRIVYVGTSKKPYCLVAYNQDRPDARESMLELCGALGFSIAVKGTVCCSKPYRDAAVYVGVSLQSYDDYVKKAALRDAAKARVNEASAMSLAPRALIVSRAATTSSIASSTSSATCNTNA